VQELRVTNTPDCCAARQQLSQQFTVPRIGAAWPGIEGAIYAGVAAGASTDSDYHLVLLADKPTGELNWKDALAWAEKLGAAVPTRDESALLYAHLRTQFEGGWHWTSTQCSDAGAWLQGFSYGGQYGGSKKAEARCRAVRRFSVQSFNPSKSAAPIVPDTTNALLRQLVDETKGLRTDFRTMFLADTEA
jgi:hypothetical protein